MSNKKDALDTARGALSRLSSAGGALSDARDELFRLSLRSTDNVEQYREIEKLCLSVSDANKAVNAIVHKLNTVIDKTPE